jgi:hypothetical protein
MEKRNLEGKIGIWKALGAYLQDVWDFLEIMICFCIGKGVD